jgi:predicted exporter
MQYRPAHLLAAVARLTLRAALRAAITVLIFTTCLTATLSYPGLPLPNLYELLERIGSVSQLAKILS